MDVPRQIGPYPVERLLGAGAMGSVFLARHPQTGAPLAIKVQHERDPELSARFAREAEVMRRINDPRVVRALDAGLHQGEPFLVLEYCPGEDLAEVLERKGALESSEAARLVAEIGRGLAAAHALGVLHRDLKPANVLLDAAGNPKVADFGLARTDKEPGAQSLTQSGVIMGTPAYMAPEQADDARRVDVRSDVYALGAILYECLSGKRPFGTGGALAVLQRVCEGELEPLPTELPPALVEVVTCAMALDPADRYSEVSVFVEALEEAGARPVEAGARSPLPLLGGALLVTTLGLGVAWGLGSSPSGVTKTPSTVASPTPSSLPPTPGAAVLPPPSPLATATPTASPTLAPRGEFPTPETPDYFPARVRFWKASLEDLRQAAAAGHPAAQTRLGAKLLRGQGAPQDLKQGLELLERAGEAGDTEAMMFLVGHHKGAQAGEAWLARAARAKSPHGLIGRALLGQDLSSARAAGELARQRLAAGDPAAYAPVAIYANLSGDFQAAAEAIERGCEWGIPAAFALKARLTRAREGERSRQAYEDFRRAAELEDPAGFCGQARWLLDQETPSRADRELAERLLEGARRAGYRGLEVERVFGLWRSGDRSAWLERIRALAAAPVAVLPSECWGELGVHVYELADELGPDLSQALKPIVTKLILRGRPPQSLDPRVTYYRALYLHQAAPERRRTSMALFKRAASQGHPEATHALGVALLRGDGVKRSVSKGVESLERAARAGHLRSWRWLGDLYARGSEVERDWDKAVACYRRAAKDPAADPSVYGMLTVAFKMQKRYEECREWGEKAVTAGDPVGSACLGSVLLQGLGGPRDAERGIRLMRSLVDRDEVRREEVPMAIKAAVLLSQVYQRGIDVPPDPELAERYRARATEHRQHLEKLKRSLQER